jgi:hypothetical protein
MRDRARALARAGLGALLAAVAPVATAQAAGDDAKAYVAFVEEPAGSCLARNAMMVLVKSTHPSRTLRVWLDRYHMGSGTGDRSRSELAPGAEPQALGCSRSADGPQEWRIVRAQLVD